MEKRSLKGNVQWHVNEYMKVNNGLFENIDTHTFAISVAALYNYKITSVERYLRKVKAELRLQHARRDAAIS